MKDSFLQLMLNILRIYITFTMIYPFFSEKMKIEKVKKLLAKLHDKKEFVIHVRNLKQALNQGIVLKKVHRIVKFNQRASLKPHFDMNTDLRKTAKNDLDKDFF